MNSPSFSRRVSQDDPNKIMLSSLLFTLARSVGADDEDELVLEEEDDDDVELETEMV